MVYNEANKDAIENGELAKQPEDDMRIVKSAYTVTLNTRTEEEGGDVNMLDGEQEVIVKNVAGLGTRLLAIAEFAHNMTKPVNERPWRQYGMPDFAPSADHAPDSVGKDGKRRGADAK